MSVVGRGIEESSSRRVDCPNGRAGAFKHTLFVGQPFGLGKHCRGLINHHNLHHNHLLRPAEYGQSKLRRRLSSYIRSTTSVITDRRSRLLSLDNNNNYQRMKEQMPTRGQSGEKKKMTLTTHCWLAGWFTRCCLCAEEREPAYVSRSMLLQVVVGKLLGRPDSVVSVALQMWPPFIVAV